jgi:hypothetical protein
MAARIRHDLTERVQLQAGKGEFSIATCMKSTFFN